MVWFLLVETPAEAVEGAPWSAGQKASGLGPKCKMSLMSTWFLGALVSNLSSETVRLNEATNVLGAVNYKSDWHCHGAGRGRCSNQKANVCETAKRVFVAPCL